MKKTLFAIFFVSLLLSPGAVLARDAKCFTKEECTKARLQLNPSLPQRTASAGWITDGEPKRVCANTSSTQYGFCLPIGKTKTNISFGGRSEFENIAEFVAFSYRYAMIIATILAVVMIIIAGIMWTISRGDQEIITKARKKISSALLGLFLLSISYTILYLINPNLVQLRLPQVWLINQQAAISPFCANNPKAKFAYVGGTGTSRLEEKTKKVEEKNLYPLTYKDDAATRLIKSPARAILCGHEYLIKDAAQLCRGDLCPLGQACFWKSDEPAPKCQKGSLIGRIFNSHPFFKTHSTLAESLLYFAEKTPLAGTDPWEWKWANEPELYIICGNGSYHRLHATANDPDRDAIESAYSQQYVITVTKSSIQQAINNCAKSGGHRGFALSLDMNSHFATFDERHLLGVNRTNRLAIDIGDMPTFEQKHFNDYLAGIKADLLLTEDEITKGYGFNVDVWEVYDIEDEAERVKAYGPHGYTSK